ncbi:RNA-binding domain-containing protein [Psychrilyobacter sp.]|uniref:RNA-binding domain-containing protein n=1 Tax=Psychrilyobacter sp. TaxID=2586924 RepID=UPI0030179130
MKIEKKEILEVLSVLKEKNENGWIEIKENKYSHEQIGETISALSNSSILEDKEYAYMIFGIKDDTWEILGTKVNLYSEKVGNQELKLWLSTQLSPSIEFDFFNFILEEKTIFIIKIKSIDHTPVQFKKEKYIRIGSNNKKLKEFPEKERLIWEKLSKFKFEEKITMKNVILEDLFELLDFKSYYRLVKKSEPELKVSMIQAFIKERYLVESSDKTLYNITNLGALLFAKDLDLFPKLVRKAIRVVRYKGKNKVHIERQQVGKKGYAAGFEGLIKFVNDLIPREEVITKDLRKVKFEISPIILRELIANAIIHQDLTKTGTEVLIEFFEDRIEVSNPGEPLIPVWQFYGYHRSRNEMLAYNMRKFGFCEELGSGIIRVIDISENENGIPPKFLLRNDIVKTVLYSHKDFDSMNEEDKLNITYFHCCYKHDQGKYMDNTSLRGRFKIPKDKYSKISRLITNAVEKGLIKKGPQKNYIPFWAGY